MAIIVAEAMYKIFQNYAHFLNFFYNLYVVYTIFFLNLVIFPYSSGTRHWHWGNHMITGAIVWLPQGHRSIPEEYGKLIGNKPIQSLNHEHNAWINQLKPRWCPWRFFTKHFVVNQLMCIKSWLDTDSALKFISYIEKKNLVKQPPWHHTTIITQNNYIYMKITIYHIYQT